MKNEITDTFIDFLRYGVDNSFEDINIKWATTNESDIKIPVVSELCKNYKNPISNIKPLNITELSKLADELYKAPSYTRQINDFLRNICKQFDDEFRKVLDEHGIPESDWKKYGSIKCENGMNKCYYKGEYIYFYTDLMWADGDNEFSRKCYFYAGEPNNDQMA